MNETSLSIKNALLTTIVLGLAACSQETPQILVTIADARANKAQHIDLGEPGDSVGDILTFDQPLLDEDMKQVGNNSSKCIRTLVEHSFQ